MVLAVCSVCGEIVATSDMQVSETLELLLAEDDDEDYSAIFGRVLSCVYGVENA